MLDNNAIEKLSANAVTNAVVRSDFLEAFISQNDKSPSWDGEVFIYNKTPKTKVNQRARLPVQVKGKLCDDFSKKIISYSMEVSDLKNYLNDGGCALFVVYIGNEGLTNKIYYAGLTPLKLMRLLKDLFENQKQKVVKLEEFPTDLRQMYSVLINLEKNCSMQKSFSRSKLYNIEELAQKGILEEIRMPVEVVKGTTPQEAIIENEVYVYAKIKDIDVLYPVKIIPEKKKIVEVISRRVSINGELFYDSYKLIISKNERCICFGESFFIKLNKNDNAGKIKYKNSGKFRIIVKDLKFFIEYLKNGYFEIDDKKIQLQINENENEFKNIDINKLESELCTFQKIVKVLDILGCKEDINLEDMDAKSWRNINYLISAFLDKKQVTSLSPGLTPLIIIGVGKLKILVLAEETKESGAYILHDYFKEEFLIQAKENDDDDYFPISQFCILTEEDLLTISNIDFSVILPSLKKQEHNLRTFSSANEFLLKLLNVYDKSSGERKDRVLSACKEISQWIYNEVPVDFDKSIKTINLLQTIKRYRKFNDEELNILYNIVKDKGSDAMTLVGAHLLLDNKNLAKSYFSELSEKEKSYFKGYPIYNFMEMY